MRKKSCGDLAACDELLREQPADCTLIPVDQMRAMLMAFGQIPHGSELAEMWWFPLDRTWNAVYRHEAIPIRQPGTPMDRQPEPLVLDMSVVKWLAEKGVIEVKESSGV